MFTYIFRESKHEPDGVRAPPTDVSIGGGSCIQHPRAPRRKTTSELHQDFTTHKKT